MTRTYSLSVHTSLLPGESFKVFHHQDIRVCITFPEKSCCCCSLVSRPQHCIYNIFFLFYLLFTWTTYASFYTRNSYLCSNKIKKKHLTQNCKGRWAFINCLMQDVRSSSCPLLDIFSTLCFLQMLTIFEKVVNLPIAGLCSP